MTTLDAAAFRDSFAHAEAAIAIFDAERRYLWVNDRFLSLTDLPRDRIAEYRVGEHLRLTPLRQDQFMTLVTSAISAGETDIVRANGERLAVEYVVIPTRIGGEPHFIGLMWPLEPHPL